MAYKIAVASGKGGTGKTTISVNLYHYIASQLTKNTILVDCDVEEPNDKIFFKDTELVDQEEINQLIPEIKTDQCTFCKKCQEYCEFNAITMIPSAGYAEVNSDLCHSCAACLVACQHNAIIEKHQAIGHVNHFNLPFGQGLMEGRLKVGSAMQTMLIGKLKEKIPDSTEIILLDAPPGTSCPVVETIIDADYIILVTEPTPFGLHDLKLMIELVKGLEKPFGIIINKAGLGNNDIYQLIQDENYELLGEIPFLLTYASHYANGNLLENISPKIEESYLKILNRITSFIAAVK